jgi:hypothetical protein
MRTYTYLLLSTTLAVSLFAGAADPFVGRWKLNVHKSKYAPGECPKSMVIEMETAGAGIRYRSETEYANGRKTKAQYSADYNGVEVIVTGSNGLLAPVSLKRIDSNTVVASYVRALQVIATSRRVVSKGGRMMTITTVSKDKDGNTVTNVGVYERVDAAAPTD